MLRARRIAGELRDELLASGLAPGSEMPESMRQLLERFHAGQTTIRQALTILQRWGVIDLPETRGIRPRISGGGELPPSERAIEDHVRAWASGKAPGTPVPRQRFADELGVGRWRVHSAISRLVAEGVIDRSRGGTSPATVGGAPARTKADDVRDMILRWIAENPGAEQIPPLRSLRQGAGNANQKAVTRAVDSLVDGGVLRRGLPRQPIRIVYPQPDLSSPESGGEPGGPAGTGGTGGTRERLSPPGSEPGR